MRYSGDGGDDHLADQEGDHESEGEEDDADVLVEEGEFHPEGGSPDQDEDTETFLQGFEGPGLEDGPDHFVAGEDGDEDGKEVAEYAFKGYVEERFQERQVGDG